MTSLSWGKVGGKGRKRGASVKGSTEKENVNEARLRILNAVAD